MNFARVRPVTKRVHVLSQRSLGHVGPQNLRMTVGLPGMATIGSSYLIINTLTH